MTENGALTILKNKIMPCVQNSEWQDAVQIAIHALEQTLCEDAVSREAVISILHTRGQKAILTFDRFEELINKLPSVQPVRRTKMTNAEKFKEVFGFELNTYAFHHDYCVGKNLEICSMVVTCMECPYENWGDKEYEPKEG